jgi:PAS domain S-box-containing protein
MLLVTPRKIWPAILLAGLAGFAIYDLQENLPIRTIGLLLLADAIEILVAALGVRYLFAGVPHLNSVKSLAKYSLFAVVLAPISVAFIARNALEGDSWWVGLFTEGLALLTLTPSILRWTEIALTRARKPKVDYLEAAALFVGLGTVAYFTFVASGIESRPALLYSLVPFLLWAALRFGITGISNSMVLVAFLAILGAVHGHGPFRANTPVNTVLFLQLFLLVSASSFMVLAAVVEGRKTAEQTVRERETALRASEERLRLAQQAARIGSFEWNIQTGVNTWTTELEIMYGLCPGGFSRTQTAFENLIHPEDRARVTELVDLASKTGQPMTGEWRVIWPDESVHWIVGRWQVFMDESGEPSRMMGVNIDITERKLADQALRESEQRLRLATLAGRMYAYDWDVTTNVVVRSGEHAKILGLAEALRSPQQEFVDKIHPDDRPKFLAIIARLTPENPTAEVTYRALSSDGTLVWLKSNGRGFFDGEGTLLRVIGMVADVTEVKRTEEALAGMTRKLIEAQEQERARIGRELHDDINQRLAMLAVQVQQLQDDPSEVQNRAREIRKELVEISNDVQALSHELHSSKLQYLGVVAGIKSWCKEYAERQKIDIECRSDVSSILPLEIGISLFRIVQEALHNAIKHSGVKRVEVQLREESGEIHLLISDLGKGFDLEAAMQGKGLGLTSMSERVRLVDGTIAIQSKPMGGTTIHVRVPLDSEHKSELAG